MIAARLLRLAVPRSSRKQTPALPELFFVKVAFWQNLPHCRAFAVSTAGDDESDNDDAFRIFGLPRRFSIDEQALKNSYRQLMSELHPDRQPHHHPTSSSSPSSTTLSASAVTRAYDRLRNKHTRATHLMELLGRPMEEASSGQLVGSEFLLEIMQLREMVDELGDGSDDRDRELKEQWSQNQARTEETCEQLDEAIQAKDLDKALELTARLQYWNRVEETIRGKIKNVD